ncbi:MAG: hypothetical protein N2689_13540, partial [Verrucomicrobiae bacterium]|nr:hypothetical protein [Verrucomicrobiae bacterium]
DVAFVIRDHDATLGDKDKLPVGHSEFLAVGCPNRERHETARQPFSDIFDPHITLLLRRDMAGVKARFAPTPTFKSIFRLPAAEF